MFNLNVIVVREMFLRFRFFDFFEIFLNRLFSLFFLRVFI